MERFHLTLRRELLDDHGPFTSVEAAQAAVDAGSPQYNADRPHQALDEHAAGDARRTGSPPIPAEQRDLLPVWLPPTLTAAPTPAAGPADRR